MRIIYTRHARKRMTQRKVAPEQVEAVLTGPDEIRPGEWEEEIAVKQFGTREIRVVYEETSEDVVIVYTVISRRLKERRRKP
jgi:hypothetical protein